MNVLQPLMDVAQSQRIVLERTNKDIESLEKLIADNPLKKCKWCSSAHNVRFTEKLTPGETKQHLISIACFSCGIQTCPQNVFVTETSSFHSAIYDAIETWNGGVK